MRSHGLEVAYEAISLLGPGRSFGPGRPGLNASEVVQSPRLAAKRAKAKRDKKEAKKKN